MSGKTAFFSAGWVGWPIEYDFYGESLLRHSCMPLRLPPIAWITFTRLFTDELLSGDLVLQH
jgi:hypothetical protein